MAIELLHHADTVRKRIAPRIALERKSELGQFMTPAPVARFMASLFPATSLRDCRLLDAGAGVGALLCAFLDRWNAGDGLEFEKVDIEAHEIDPSLRVHLDGVLASYTGSSSVTYKIFSEDFIKAAALQSLGARRFTHSILNPLNGELCGMS